MANRVFGDSPPLAALITSKLVGVPLTFEKVSGKLIPEIQDKSHG